MAGGPVLVSGFGKIGYNRVEFVYLGIWDYFGKVWFLGKRVVFWEKEGDKKWKEILRNVFIGYE